MIPGMNTTHVTVPKLHDIITRPHLSNSQSVRHVGPDSLMKASLLPINAPAANDYRPKGSRRNLWGTPNELSMTGSPTMIAREAQANNRATINDYSERVVAEVY